MIGVDKIVKRLSKSHSDSESDQSKISNQQIVPMENSKYDWNRFRPLILLSLARWIDLILYTLVALFFIEYAKKLE